MFIFKFWRDVAAAFTTAVEESVHAAASEQRKFFAQVEKVEWEKITMEMWK